VQVDAKTEVIVSKKGCEQPRGCALSNERAPTVGKARAFAQNVATGSTLGRRSTAGLNLSSANPHR